MVSADLRPSKADKLPRLYEVAAGQGGHFTAAQAREVGYSARSLLYHATAGRFERISRGFYRLVGVPAGLHDDVLAAWLRFAHRHAVVSHDTALALYDLAPTRSQAIHLTLPRRHRPRSSLPATGIELHTTTVALRRDELATRFGVTITSPARTIADVAEIGVDPSVVVDATTRALASGLVTAGELRGAVKRRSVRVRRLVERAIREAGAHA